MDRVNMKLNPKNLTYSHANNTLIIAVSVFFLLLFYRKCENKSLFFFSLVRKTNRNSNNGKKNFK